MGIPGGEPPNGWNERQLDRGGKSAETEAKRSGIGCGGCAGVVLAVLLFVIGLLALFWERGVSPRALLFAIIAFIASGALFLASTVGFITDKGRTALRQTILVAAVVGIVASGLWTVTAAARLIGWQSTSGQVSHNDAFGPWYAFKSDLCINYLEFKAEIRVTEVAFESGEYCLEGPAHFGVMDPSLSVDDTVTVYYNPDNPRDASLTDPRSPFTRAIAVAAGSAGVVVVLFFERRRRRNRGVARTEDYPWFSPRKTLLLDIGARYDVEYIGPNRGVLFLSGAQLVSSGVKGARLYEFREADGGLVVLHPARIISTELADRET